MQPGFTPAPVLNEFKTVGKKVFWFWLIQRLVPLAFILIFILVLRALAGNYIYGIVSSQSVSAADNTITTINILLALIVSIILLVAGLSVFITWLQYTHYSYAFNANAFMTRRGIFHIEEFSIPYNKIQHVEIERPLLYRMIGISKVIVTSAGNEESDPTEVEPDGVISFIDELQAITIQQELLQRSNVQHVVTVGPVTPTQ